MISPVAPLWPADYNLPADHCADVLAGAYDVPYDPASPPVILDLGANVGAFCRWASSRWPGCTIHAYEPQPANYAMLVRTVKEMLPTEKILCVPCAIGQDTIVAKLYDNGVNCGEWSLFDQNTDKPSLIVPVMDAATLPKADILKMDVEGAEVAILASLAHRITEFSAIMMETHSAEAQNLAKQFLDRVGFQLTHQITHAEHRHELMFVRRDQLKS